MAASNAVAVLLASLHDRSLSSCRWFAIEATERDDALSIAAWTVDSTLFSDAFNSIDVESLLNLMLDADNWGLKMFARHTNKVLHTLL